MEPSHLFGFLITLVLLTYLLYPWSQENIKENREKMKEGFVDLESRFNLADEFENLFNYVLQSRRMAHKYERRIKALKSQLENRGTVRIEDYKKILNDISKIIEEEYQPDRAVFILKQDSQNIEIENLYNQVKDLEEKLNKKSDDKIDRHAIGSIKSLDSGINFNVKQLHKNKLSSLDNDQKDKIFAQEKHPLMIHLNNGCLTYEANGKYGTQHCEMQNPKQYLIYQQISNRHELNKHISDPELHVTEKTDLPRLYPFNIITPYHDPKMCLQADHDGVSLEDCRSLNSNDQQKWVDYALPRAGCRVKK